MTTYEPEQGFREALTRIDVGEADLIVTVAADAAQWAKDHGYDVTQNYHKGNLIYEIRSSDSF